MGLYYMVNNICQIYQSRARFEGLVEYCLPFVTFITITMNDSSFKAISLPHESCKIVL